ncbi:RimK family alpha-L-glutamate ligase [Candidatus Woesearchaeota archaeon]|nr:RimK family alpha-L-glutamate ligase [Candidatus Woesearchaeota archaeon]
MKAAMISLGSKSSKWTAEAMRKYFEIVDEINLKKVEVNIGSKEDKILVEGKPIGKYDCVYVKGSYKYAGLLRAIVTELDDSTYSPFEPRSFTLVHNKLLTQLQLEKENIPMPKTYVAATTDAAKKILEKINYPIIMKLPSGTQGKGVMVADSYAAAASMLDTLESLNQPFILQEYIETDSEDVRLFVVGEKVVACMKRKSLTEEVRSNIHAGGVGEAYEADTNTKKIAIRTAKLLGAEVCGVDILESIKGPLVIEANLSPGLQGIMDVTNINVADKIAKYLYEKTLSFKEQSGNGKKRELLKDLGINQAEKNGDQSIISTLDFRGGRILLPELITNFSKFKEGEEYVIEASEGKLVIKKLNIK